MGTYTLYAPNPYHESAPIRVFIGGKLKAVRREALKLTEEYQPKYDRPFFVTVYRGFVRRNAPRSEDRVGVVVNDTLGPMWFDNGTEYRPTQMYRLNDDGSLGAIVIMHQIKKKKKKR